MTGDVDAPVAAGGARGSLPRLADGLMRHATRVHDGHIGSQLSVLADAMGMSVIYYDVVNLMAMGMAKQVPTLENLLNEADFVTLHVPELPETRNLISANRICMAKPG